MTDVDRLCFGTSTFVAGRLLPGKDSRPGLAALRAALDAGIRTIHSNPHLGTQWAVREVLDEVGPVAGLRHLIKAECPLRGDLEARISTAIEMSTGQLGISRIDALVLQVDLKRTERTELLNDQVALGNFYRTGARVAFASGRIGAVYAYCHGPAAVRAALREEPITAIAAQYHLASPWPISHLAQITRAGRSFVGMSPLNRGALIDPLSRTASSRLRPLTWALRDPRVETVAITMSSPDHVHEVIDTAQHTQRSRPSDPHAGGTALKETVL
ncbi:hypothetical protein [Streptacidiphilus albus]|uniref:hypothetical protein n=1 Tax=Streptacidiphilus albus TaxID=105425 RepID=UPI00054C11CF|nr:hypothetical protein [Streptacidiphilus albus]